MNRKVILGVGAGAAALLLCVCLVAVGFIVGQQTTDSADADLVATAEVIVKEAEGSEDADSASAEGSNEQANSSAAQPDVVDNGVPEVEVGSLPPEQRGEITLSEEDLQLMLEVWELVGREFDGELPTEEDVTYGAIAGSLELLGDQFTSFSPPAVAEDLREQLRGNYQGIGAYVDITEDGYLIITQPISGSPAEEAGLVSEDLVIAVNGEDVIGKTLDEIIALVKGPEGTEVILTIQRAEETPFDVTIVRAQIEIPTVEAEMLEDNIAYVRLNSFSRNAEEQLSDALVELLAQEPAGLILDLRFNPGGYLDQSVAVADLFLDEGVVLFERSQLAGIENTFRSNSGDMAEDIPLVILVNGGSASASEIVAGAIQDRGRGVLIGEVTFGKGSVQQPHTLSDGSELRITIARWYTPNNQTINGQGITPDIEVEMPEEFGNENDTQIQRAVEYLLTGQ